jgi:glycosyltransferase involved in cell wall biosynthesis
MEAASPLVSIVIPTRDRPAMLAEAIASVRAQSFRNYEIIVVSNGEQNSLASRRAAAGCRFLTLSEGNRSLARNIAIKEARGEWLAFLDDDDLWEPDKLLHQLVFAYHEGADCVFTDFVLYDVPSGRKQAHAIGPVNARVCAGLTIPESFMVWRAGTGGCSTALVKREVLLALGGFDPSMTLVEDWDMWRRVSQRGRVGYLAEPLSVLRTHSANGEAHAVLRPWRCTYWEIYHAAKIIMTCPPELRHMIPRTLRYIAKRALIWHPIFVVAGLKIASRRPFEPIFQWGRPLYRRIAGDELRALREWLRPRRRINALLRREIFRRPKLQPIVRLKSF